jgi:hypothetical protein
VVIAHSKWLGIALDNGRVFKYTSYMPPMKKYHEQLSVPISSITKELLIEEADRRELKIADVIREILDEHYNITESALESTPA